MKTLFPIFLFLLLIGLGGCNEELLIEPAGTIQQGSIHGQVLNKKDGSGVPRAAVRISSTGQTVQTDTLGRFRFDSVSVGKYTVQATKASFRDEVTTVEVSQSRISVVVLHLVNENNLPTEPQLVAPAAGTSTVSISPVLKWKATDPNHDPLTYEVVVTREGEKTPMQTITGHKPDSVMLKDLSYNTTYYWQVTVSDGVSSVTGKMWSFRTAPFPDLPYVFARRVDGQYQIFATGDKGTPIQLTHRGSNWRPVVSPNGEQIAFISNVETELHLFVMQRDGSKLHRVTNVPVGGLDIMDLSFCWIMSPLGTELLYPSNNRLLAVRVSTDVSASRETRQVAQTLPGRSFAGCDWTVQGNRIIARTTGTSVYQNYFTVMSADGKDATTVSMKSGSRVGNPAFSITGKQVLFSYDKDSFQDEQGRGRQLNAQIAVLNLETMKESDVVGGSGSQSAKDPGTNDLEPRYSPDGAKIIFTNLKNTGTGTPVVWTMDVNGQNRTPLITSAEMACWRTVR